MVVGVAVHRRYQLRPPNTMLGELMGAAALLFETAFCFQLKGVSMSRFMEGENHQQSTSKRITQVFGNVELVEHDLRIRQCIFRCTNVCQPHIHRHFLDATALHFGQCVVETRKHLCVPNFGLYQSRGQWWAETYSLPSVWKRASIRSQDVPASSVVVRTSIGISNSSNEG